MLNFFLTHINLLKIVKVKSFPNYIVADQIKLALKRKSKTENNNDIKNKALLAYSIVNALYI